MTKVVKETSSASTPPHCLILELPCTKTIYIFVLRLREKLSFLLLFQQILPRQCKQLSLADRIFRYDDIRQR